MEKESTFDPKGLKSASLDPKMFQVWLKEPPVLPLMVAPPKHGGMGRPQDHKLDRFDL